MDAAARLLGAARRELAVLDDLSAERESMGGLLYAVAIAWVDVAIDGGILSPDEPEYDELERAYAHLSRRVEDMSLPCPDCGIPNHPDHWACVGCGAGLDI